MRTRKAYFRGLYEIELHEEEIGDPGPDEVILKVKACAICASDYGFWERTKNPGHKVAGVIEQMARLASMCRKGGQDGCKIGVRQRRHKYRW